MCGCVLEALGAVDAVDVRVVRGWGFVHVHGPAVQETSVSCSSSFGLRMSPSGRSFHNQPFGPGGNTISSSVGSWMRGDSACVSAVFSVTVPLASFHNGQECVRCSREIIRLRQRAQCAHTAFGIFPAVIVNARFLHCKGRRAVAARDEGRGGRAVIILAALKGHRSIWQKSTSIRLEPTAPHSLDRHTLHAE